MYIVHICVCRPFCTQSYILVLQGHEVGLLVHSRYVCTFASCLYKVMKLAYPVHILVPVLGHKYTLPTGALICTIFFAAGFMHVISAQFSSLWKSIDLPARQSVLYLYNVHCTTPPPHGEEQGQLYKGTAQPPYFCGLRQLGFFCVQTDS